MTFKARERRVKFGLVGCLSIVIALVGMAVLLLVGPYRDTKLRSQVAQCRVEMANLVAAIASYEKQFGRISESNNAAILHALRGHNPRKLAFLDVHARSLDENQSFVDPWRTPYQVQMISTNKVSVRSAGPNNRFGDEDDIVSPP